MQIEYPPDLLSTTPMGLPDSGREGLWIIHIACKKGASWSEYIDFLGRPSFEGVVNGLSHARGNSDDFENIFALGVLKRL